MYDDDGSEQSPQIQARGFWQGFTYVGRSRHQTSRDPSLWHSAVEHNRWSGVAAATPAMLNDSSAAIAVLSSAVAGDRVRVVALNCGASDRNLIAMGLMPGVELQVLSLTVNGSVLVEVQGQQVGFGAELANRIQIEWC
jgi:Fe2+ transport system protein FeoA